MWHPENFPLKKNDKGGQSPFEWKIPPKNIYRGGQSPQNLYLDLCPVYIEHRQNNLAYQR